MESSTISEGGFAVRKRGPGEFPDNKKYVRVGRQQIIDHGAELGLEGLGLLLLIDFFADNKTRKCFPSDKLMAKMGGTTPKRIRRLKPRLDMANPALVKIYPRGKRPSGRYYRNQQYIVLDNLGE